MSTTTTETYTVPNDLAPQVVQDVREFGALDVVAIVRTDETTTFEVTWSTHPAHTEGAQS